MEEKKIVYIHTGEWPSPSPSIVFVTGTAWGLAHHVRTVLIVRNNSGDDTPAVFSSLTGFEPPGTLDIIRIGYGGDTPGHSRFFREAAGRVAALAKNSSVEAVVTRNIGFLPYAFYLRKRYSIPCFFETHDFYGDFSLRPDLRKTIHTRRNRLYEKTFLPRIDGIICLTRVQQDIFDRYYPGTPSCVAHTGLFRVERSRKPREKKVCYVGSLEAHKGVGTVLSALDHTADKGIGLLVIGGKNEHEIREFRNFANLLNVGDRVRVTGWVHHSDIGHMMDRCIAGVVPLSDTPFNRYFTSPLKILDCFSRSMPVIGSALPTVREYVEDGRHGILFAPNDPESLAEAMDRFTAGRMFDTMSPKVEAHAVNFLYTERGKTIVEFIRNVAGGAR